MRNTRRGALSAAQQYRRRKSGPLRVKRKPFAGLVAKGGPSPLLRGGRQLLIDLELSIKDAFTKIASVDEKVRILRDISNAYGITATFDFDESQLPKKAPVLWTGEKSTGKNPEEFIAATYEQWIGRGLVQAHIRQLDRSLYFALHNWLKTHKLTIDLPTKKQAIDREVQALGFKALRLTGVVLPPEAKKRRRLYAAAHRRLS